MFPFFFAGALFGHSEKARALIAHNNWVYTLSVVIYFALMLTGTSVDFITLTGPFAIVILMNLFARHDAKIPRWLATVGEYSLEIYVFHWFFFPSMPWLKGVLAMNPTGALLNNYNFVPTLIVFTFLVAGVIAVCMLLGAIIRHSPLLSMIILGARFDKKPKHENNSEGGD